MANLSGGFFPDSLPSPAPSTSSHSSTASNLPHPRSHPLKAGSAKEDAARRYVENKLLQISRRYVKKFQPEDDKAPGEANVKGFVSFAEVAKELGEVVDVLWLSGTPSLQIPYLLNVTGAVNSYLPAFPPSPKASFVLLRKLDHALSSLLKGEDSQTGEILPGFEGGLRRGLSGTDMVRLKNLVQGTRVIMVEIMNGNVDLAENDAGTDVETETDDDGAMDVDDGEEGAEYEMDVARIYEDTIMRLGELLEDDGSWIGIPDFSKP